MKVAVVTDSTSDIPPDLARELRVTVVPAVLVIDGQDYADGEGISRTEFYQRLPEMVVLPTTAAPASGSFTAVYHQCFEAGADRILSIHVASRLSGIFSAARIAAEPFESRIQVVDSGQLSMGLGFQALAAAERAQAGGSLEDLLEAVARIRARIRVVAMLDTLKYLRRSGRVSWMQANLGAVLQVKSFVTVEEGEVLPLGQVRTRRKGIQQLIAELENLGPLERLAVLHTNAPEEARRLYSSLESPPAQDPVFINVTSVIGTHVGPNGLGFAGVLAEEYS